MKKKKLLFVMPHLKTGGITSAFVNLINSIHKVTWLDIEVLLFDADDRDKLPSNVNVLPQNPFLRILAVSQEKIMRESRAAGFFRILFGGVAKFFGSAYAYKILFTLCRKVEKYDYAISFAQSGPNKSLYGGMNEFVLRKVVAAKKISFLHCDYKLAGIHSKSSAKNYKRFDCIAAVSQGVKDVFLSCMPELENKVHVVHNCHQFSQISQAFLDSIIYSKDYFNILTVARISEEKGIFRMGKIFSELKREGFAFRWHIVGSGTDKNMQKLTEMISEYSLENDIILYNEQRNPYPFFVNADLFLLPSFHEAAPMVFTEAEYLKLPILTTETTSTKEFIIDKQNGIVCRNTDDDIYKQLKKILVSPQIIYNIKQNLQQKPFPTNELAVQEFIRLIK